MTASVLIAVALLLGAPPPAATRRPADPKASAAKQRECLRAMSARVAKITFGRKDVERHLAEWRSFEALDDRGGADEVGGGTECVDLSAAVADPRYVAWARQRGLDPGGWLLASMRITLTFAKRQAPAQAAEMRRQLEKVRRDLEAACSKGSRDACATSKQAAAGADELAREVAALTALFPEPTRAEAALLDEYADRLRAAAEDPEERRGERTRGDADDEDDGAR